MTNLECTICGFRSNGSTLMGKHYQESHPREFDKVDLEITLDEMVSKGLLEKHDDETFTITEKGKRWYEERKNDQL